MKTKPIESALHDWVHTLPFQQQALLMTGMRGPDQCSKFNSAKVIVRYLRGVVIKAAGQWNQTNNNDFMWGDYAFFEDWTRRFWNDHDAYPHHFLMHLFHCAEVVGYKHPDPGTSVYWLHFYKIGVKNFHLNEESEEEMDYRLDDFGNAKNFRKEAQS